MKNEKPKLNFKGGAQVSAKAAGESFLTNFRLLGGSDAEPEKYNLYKGLVELAAAVEKIEEDMKDIKDFMVVMKSKSLAVHI
jgi:hypothetical protein